MNTRQISTTKYRVHMYRYWYMCFTAKLKLKVNRNKRYAMVQLIKDFKRIRSALWHGAVKKSTGKYAIKRTLKTSSDKQGDLHESM